MSTSEKKAVKFVYLPFILLAVFFTVLILGGLYTFLREKDYKQYLNQLYAVQKDSDNWLVNYKSAKDSGDETTLADLAEKKDEILTRLDILAKKSFSYIRQDALFTKGLIYNEQKEYIVAAETFAKIFYQYSHSLIGVKSGLNAAAAYENAGEMETALELYKKVSKIKKVPKIWEEAGFHTARMMELKDTALAMELYKKLINQLEDNNFWRILAENRLLSLELKH